MRFCSEFVQVWSNSLATQFLYLCLWLLAALTRKYIPTLALASQAAPETALRPGSDMQDESSRKASMQFVDTVKALFAQLSDASPDDSMHRALIQFASRGIATTALQESRTAAATSGGMPGKRGEESAEELTKLQEAQATAIVIADDSQAAGLDESADMVVEPVRPELIEQQAEMRAATDAPEVARNKLDEEHKVAETGVLKVEAAKNKLDEEPELAETRALEAEVAKNKLDEERKLAETRAMQAELAALQAESKLVTDAQTKAELVEAQAIAESVTRMKAELAEARALAETSDQMKVELAKVQATALIAEQLKAELADAQAQVAAATRVQLEQAEAQAQASMRATAELAQAQAEAAAAAAQAQAELAEARAEISEHVAQQSQQLQPAEHGKPTAAPKKSSKKMS